jgi:hypothetical protein
VIDSAVDAVTATIQTEPGSGAVLSGSSATAISGVVTFDDVAIDHNGAGFVLQFSASDMLASVSGSSFDITGSLFITAQPQVSGSSADVMTLDTFTVELRNSQNAKIETSGTVVTAAFESHDFTPALSSSTATVSAGVATFSSVTIDKAGSSYKLTFSAALMVSITSSTFDCFCALGYTNSSNMFTCTACPADYYKDTLSMSVCTECPYRSNTLSQTARTVNTYFVPGSKFFLRQAVFEMPVADFGHPTLSTCELRVDK